MPNPYSSTIKNQLRELWQCICKLQQGGDSPVVTQNSATITFTGNGTVGNPLIATYIGPAGAAPANPTAVVGLAAVNGTATTFLRSDGAPALSQAIVPTWTGLHTFSVGMVANPPTTIAGSFLNNNISGGTPAVLAQRVESGNGVVTGSTVPITPLILRNNYGVNTIKVGQGINLQFQLQQASTVNESFRIAVVATTLGATSSEVQFWNQNVNVSQQVKTISPAGQIQFNKYTTVGSFPGTAVGHLAFDATGQIITVATPTGTAPVDATSTVGLTVTAGTANTPMRSDSAPALSQAIVPTWTGAHTFTAAATDLLSTVTLKGVGNTFLEFWNTVATANNKRWVIGNGPTNLLTYCYADDGQSLQTATRITRNGIAVQTHEWLTNNITRVLVDVAGTTTFPTISNLGTTNGVATVSIASTNPTLELSNTTNSIDQRRWAHTISGSGGAYIFRAFAGDGTTSNAGIAFQAFRGGSQVDDVQLWAGGVMQIKAHRTTGTTFNNYIKNVSNSGAVTTVAVTNQQSGMIFSNTGATATITYNLPAATVGLFYEFYNIFATGGANTMIVKANGTDTIQNGTGTSVAGGVITGDVQGSNVKLVCLVAGQWVVFNDQGTLWGTT